MEAVGKVGFQSLARNQSSARGNSGVVMSYIQAECMAGIFLWPLHPSPLAHVSPIKLVPKNDQPVAWRMIVDLCHPQRHSVNGVIPPTLFSLQYLSIIDEVAVILSMGGHSHLLKSDLRSVYGVLPIHLMDKQLRGPWSSFHVGRWSAPKIFIAFADAVARALRAAGVPLLVHYLDDFLIFIHPGSNNCLWFRWVAMQVLEGLITPVAWSILEGPSTSVTFHGILIDTVCVSVWSTPASS